MWDRSTAGPSEGIRTLYIPYSYWWRTIYIPCGGSRVVMRGCWVSGHWPVVLQFLSVAFNEQSNFILTSYVSTRECYNVWKELQKVDGTFGDFCQWEELKKGIEEDGADCYTKMKYWKKTWLINTVKLLSDYSCLWLFCSIFRCWQLLTVWHVLWQHLLRPSTCS